jgi:hypothetical protein
MIVSSISRGSCKKREADADEGVDGNGGGTCTVGSSALAVVIITLFFKILNTETTARLENENRSLSEERIKAHLLRETRAEETETWKVFFRKKEEKDSVRSNNLDFFPSPLVEGCNCLSIRSAFAVRPKIQMKSQVD